MRSLRRCRALRVHVAARRRGRRETGVGEVGDDEGLGGFLLKVKAMLLQLYAAMRQGPGRSLLLCVSGDSSNNCIDEPFETIVCRS